MSKKLNQPPLKYPKIAIPRLKVKLTKVKDKGNLKYKWIKCSNQKT